MTTWTKHPNCSEFGSPSEDSQNLALASKVYGHAMTCKQANAKGIYYFATCPDWVNGGKKLMNSNGTQVFPNVQMPAALKQLPAGAKVRFRYGGKEAIGIFLDVGPASWTKRYLDLGYPLARYFNFPGTGTVEWTLELTDSPSTPTSPLPPTTGGDMPTVEQTLDKARADIGIHEIPVNSNKTPIGEWYGMNGVAWCAEGVSKWLITSGFKVKKNAGADELAAELVSDYHWQKVSPASMKAGDVGLFTFSHIGMIEKRIDAATVQTIEANSGDGGVHRKTRHNSEFSYGVRPPYGSAAPKPQPKPEPPIPKGQALTTAEVTVTNDTGGSVRGTVPANRFVWFTPMKNKWGRYPVAYGALEGFAVGDHLLPSKEK